MNQPPPPLRIGIAGLGTVGCGVVDILRSQSEMLAERAGRPILLTVVSARSKEKDRGIDLSGTRWEANAIDLALCPDVDVVVELMGGSEGKPYDLVKFALTHGKHVVTANKALIAHHGAELAELAEDKGAELRYEAAVAGGIPIIKLLREGLAANRLHRVAGIMNGTCNYILTTMEKTGRDFAVVLGEAQHKGYAEADPTFDIDGIDTAHKLAIAAALASGTLPNFDALPIEGIRRVTAADIRYAAELGYRIKLLGIAEVLPEGIAQRVHPALVPLHSPLGQVDDVYNAVQVSGDAVGDVFIEGRGAGRGPTASSVVADILDIARGLHQPPFVLPASRLQPLVPLPMEALESAYYLRLTVLDKPGVMAAVTGVFRDTDISLMALMQHAHKPGEPVDIVITTHRTREAKMQAALTMLATLEAVVEEPNMIRMME